MWWTDGSDVILVMAGATALFTGVIYACCSGCRQSRCNKIHLGCCSCERENLTAEEIAMEKQSQDANVQTAGHSRV